MRTKLLVTAVALAGLLPAACCSHGVDRREAVGSLEFSTRTFASRTRDDVRATASFPERAAAALRRDLTEYPRRTSDLRRVYCGE